MNKLDYCVSLRAKGLSKKEIIDKMAEKGFENSEIDYYLKKSDDVFLNHLLNNKTSKPKTKTKRGFKTFILLLCLALLVAVFYGYFTMGLIGLLIMLKLVRFSSYKS